MFTRLGLERFSDGTAAALPPGSATGDGEASGKGEEAVKRWLAFLCYSAILADGLFMWFLIGTGGFFWAIPHTGIPLIVPPAVVLWALVLAARRI